MEMLADLMASTFINDPLRRQQVLEELTLNQRLRLVIQYLREEPRQRGGLAIVDFAQSRH
jgi:predicted urease superfamily metal-dependent hydrolase